MARGEARELFADRRLVDFAENALDEAIENRASVVQEDFIIIAGLGCRKDSFSRFIKNVVLSWGRNGRVGVG